MIFNDDMHYLVVSGGVNEYSNGLFFTNSFNYLFKGRVNLQNKTIVGTAGQGQNHGYNFNMAFVD